MQSGSGATIIATTMMFQQHQEEDHGDLFTLNILQC